MTAADCCDVELLKYDSTFVVLSSLKWFRAFHPFAFHLQSCCGFVLARPWGASLRSAPSLSLHRTMGKGWGGCKSFDLYLNTRKSFDLYLNTCKSFDLYLNGCKSFDLYLNGCKFQIKVKRLAGIQLKVKGLAGI